LYSRYLFFAFIFFSFHQAISQHTKVETWYDSKHIVPKEIYFVTQKSPHSIDSLYTSYFQNGNLKSKGYYNRGKAEGPWEYYYENGNVKMSGDLKDNINYGIWTYYYENGKINMKGEVEKGLREGEWKFFYENGNLKSSGTFKKDMKDGAWDYFYEDNIYKAHAEFEKDKGTYSEYYTNGNIKGEGQISNGKSNGIWKYYYEDGSKQAEGTEKNGVKEGTWKFYHKNGQVSSEGPFVNGKQEGNWKYYHENGNLSSEGAQKEGEKDGFWKLYYVSGQFKAEGNFAKGDGPYKEYYESGKLKIEGYVKKDKNDGLWIYYYEDGAKEGECFFTEGKGQYKGFYPNGKTKMEGRIENGNKVGVWSLYKEDGTLAGYYKTYYENDVPVFKPVEENPKEVKGDTVKRIKPTFTSPKKKSRYFTKKVNEKRDFIVSAGPLGFFAHQIPVSIEYYFQERLGYELNFTSFTKPFLKGAGSIPINEEYIRGFSVGLRQKLYQKDKDKGMFYYAQELRFTSNEYYNNHQDSTPAPLELFRASEKRYEFCLIFGDRLIKDPKKKGWTLDIFGGIGLGYKEITKKYSGNRSIDSLFPDLKEKTLTIPVRLGFNIGYLF
jgi:antitoxin component YwqK of YwqJK toxin-antitoxin module